ncbi:regulatory signaling modulator protein AmpE [Legionella worsleiensis]|uniref:Inner membrane protein AmpE n=1 Tax=Legionella worsleiensis TaxID=45076 RepID=A0A0W1AJ45_9GAMM|nr:regulatory signaling modulator protein AmpE [Legionella worsleiensis]KTD81355.1 inner membrane protein AmpE [Legionella worsleiensis]STY29947.1 inner membrane protein AmpE [Legionella worsleiensis]
MKLLVVVLCLLSERFLIHSISYQRFSWFGDYFLLITNALEKRFKNTNPWIHLAAVVLPLVLLTALIYFLFQNLFFGFTGLLLSIAIFFYCLGPQNPFYPCSESDSKVGHSEFIGDYFARVNGQLFTVIFWYILAGPVAILSYRLIALCKNNDEVSQQAKQLSHILEWLPARITALLYLLVGNFQRSITTFLQYAVNITPDSSYLLLSECGLQAVKLNESDEVPIPNAEALVEHAAIVMVVFLALFTLAAWL